MSGGTGGGEVRKVSRQDIQLAANFVDFCSEETVQNLIERCLQLYMNQREVVDTLSLHAKIEPSFTELVWQKLEEENREFFKAYYVRLMLKNQITIFNKLLEEHCRLMNKEHASGVTSVLLPNGSNPSSLNHPVPTELADGMVMNGGGSSNSVINGGQASEGLIYVNKDMTVLGMDAAGMMSSHNPTSVGYSGVNGAGVHVAPNYSGNHEIVFGNDQAFGDPCPSIGDASGGSFSTSDLADVGLSDSLLEIDGSSYGILSQIPRNFNFSDLTADFSQSADILESYTRSPFLPSQPNNFDSGSNSATRRMDNISEGCSYDDFASD